MFKCNASELLTASLLVRRFSEEKWARTASTVSHELLCDVLDLLAMVKAGGVVGDQLRHAIANYLRASSAESSGREAATRAKRNWALHLPKQIE